MSAAREPTPDDSRRYDETLDHRLSKTERRCAEFEARAEAKFQAIEEDIRSLQDESGEGVATVTDLRVQAGKLEALPGRMDKLEAGQIALGNEVSALKGRLYGIAAVLTLFVPLATAGLVKLVSR